MSVSLIFHITFLFKKIISANYQIAKIEKILTLFNIKDPDYFSQKIFELPQHVNKRDIKDYAKLYAEKVPGEERDFEQSMCMISDFVSLIELMNKVNNINDI